MLYQYYKQAWVAPPFRPRLLIETTLEPELPMSTVGCVRWEVRFSTFLHHVGSFYLSSGGDLRLVDGWKLLPLPPRGACDPVGVAVAPVLPLLQSFVEFSQSFIDRFPLHDDVVVSSGSDLTPEPQGFVLTGERLGMLGCG